MAIRLKVQDTTGVTLKVGGSDTARLSAESGILLYPDEYAGAYSVTPTEAEQTLQTEGLMMTDDVTVGAIDAEYVGSEVPRRTSLNVSGLTVTAPSGYYANALSETVVPVLEDVTKSYTPTETAQSETFTAGTGYDGIGEVSVTVAAATLQEKSRTIGASGTYEDTADNGYYGLSKVTNTVPSGSMSIAYDTGYYTSNNLRKWRFRGTANVNPKGWFAQGNNYGNYISYDAVPSGTTITPTESAQTVGGANMMMEAAATIAAIPSDYVASGVPRKTSSDLVVSGRTITAPAGYYENSASQSVSSSYIIPQGSQTLTQDGTYNVTTLAQVVVDTPSYTDGDNVEYGHIVINDLTNTTWYLDTTPDLTDEALYYINFTANSENYDGFELGHNEIFYYENGAPAYLAYVNGVWHEAWRTISITGGTDATNANLIAWLQANATQQ